MHRASSVESVLRFGDFEIDDAVRQLRRGGRVVALEPKPFELLLLLVRARERVVRRDELMRTLWPDVVVSEATLSATVRRVRSALAPEGELIQGVRKIGYRFVGKVVGPHPALVPFPAQAAAASSIEPSPSPFVGRTAELSQLADALEAALAGRGSVVTVAGEPGIGKTTTVEELLRRHAHGRAEVLVGRCYEGEGGQAFLPWIQIFREFSAHRDDHERARDLAGEGVDIARLTAATGASPAGGGDPEVLRARLFDSAVAVLLRAARQSPLVLVLDDLHWADRASTTLLLALAREVADVALLVIATCREAEVDDDHPTGSVLAQLRRERLLLTLELTPLRRDEASELIAVLAGAPVEEAILGAVYDTTEGNPLFVHEYWRDLDEAGLLVRNADGWQSTGAMSTQLVPRTVAETIARRVRRLRHECVQLLSIAAVVGRDFRHEVVAAVATTTPGEAIELFDEALTAGVVTEDPSTPGAYRFAHGLTRATLYEGMSRMRRAVLHRSVAEAMEQSPAAAGSREMTAELAHHFLLAAPAGTAPKAVAYAERAALEATQSCAYDAAVAYLDQAVGFAEGRAADVAAPRLCELYLQRGEAVSRAGDGSRARICFQQAAELARSLAEPLLLARAAIGMASRWVIQDEQAVRLLEEALAALPASEVGVRARVQAALAKSLYFFDGTRTRRESLCREARQAAVVSGDAVLQGEVLAESLDALFHSDDLAQQEELQQALTASASSSADTRLRLLGQAWRIVNLMRRGHLNDADVVLLDFLRLAEELREPRFLFHGWGWQAALLLARGRLVDAERRSQEALRVGATIARDAAAWIHWTQIFHVRREQARVAEFLSEGPALRPPEGAPNSWFYERNSRWVLPHIYCELGRFEEASTEFDALLDEESDRLPPNNARHMRIVALVSLSDACWTLRRRDAAGRLHALLAPYADQWCVIGWGVVVLGSTHLLLGVLRATEQRWDAATDHFEEALRQQEQQGAAWVQARTFFRYAEVLKERGRKRDAKQIRDLIDRGVALATEHGLKAVEARLRRLAT